MDKDNLNISKVETYLNSIFDNVISINTFFGNVPEPEFIQKEDWKDLVCVEIPDGIQDKNAMGDGLILVWLYAKPMSSGRKNVTLLSQMEMKLNAVLEKANSKIYHLSRGMTYTAFDKELKWHCNVVELIIKVF